MVKNMKNVGLMDIYICGFLFGWGLLGTIGSFLILVDIYQWMKGLFV